MKKKRTYEELKKGNLKSKYDERELKIYLWEDGGVSLSYNEDKEKYPYFVLTNENRKKLIKLLTSKQIK